MNSRAPAIALAIMSLCFVAMLLSHNRLDASSDRLVSALQKEVAAQQRLIEALKDKANNFERSSDVCGRILYEHAWVPQK